MSKEEMYMRDDLSGKGAGVFADGLKQAVCSGLGNVQTVGQGGFAKQAQSGQEDSSSNIRQGNTGLKSVSLNARSIINKKSELNIMVHDSDPHIICTS